MATYPSTKNPLVVLRGFRNNLSERTNVTNFDLDSKARTLSDVLTEEQVQYREETLTAFYANQITTARGKDLDAVGLKEGVERKIAAFAGTTRNELNVAFYVDGGTFGGINGGFDIVIPGGTVVFSDAQGNELNTQIEYETVGSHTLPAASSIRFVSLRAKVSGSGSNVGQLTLRNHSFNGYADAAANTLKVINFYPIINGRNDESDDLYRFRITQQYDRIASSNSTKIKMESVDIPGVVDVRVNNGYYGIGTAAAVVLGAEFQTTPSIVSGVQAKLNSIRGPGLGVSAISASEAKFDFDLEIETARNLTVAEQNNLRSEVNRIILGYFRTIAIGGDVTLSDLGRLIATNSRYSISLNRTSGSNLFKKTFIRRGSLSAGFSVKEKVAVDTYRLENDEFASLGNLTITFR